MRGIKIPPQDFPKNARGGRGRICQTLWYLLTLLHTIFPLSGSDGSWPCSFDARPPHAPSLTWSYAGMYTCSNKYASIFTCIFILWTNMLHM